MIQKVFWDLVIGIMNKILRINNLNNKIGISSIKKEISYDFELNFKKIYNKCKKYTMTSIEECTLLFLAYSSLEEVKGNFQTINYPKNKIEYIKGVVGKTISGIIPKEISILRLETDWYKSTYHEQKYLYPRLSKNGILIKDDYGYWKGSREATDKYFKENHIKMFLHRIDHTGRIGIKLN